MSYRVFYFERTGDGNFKAPADYPPNAMAAVTTHDLPTLTGYWQGEDIRLKSTLGLYPDPGLAAADAENRPRDRQRLLQTLGLEGQDLEGEALPSNPPEENAGSAAAAACPEAVRFGVLEYLAQSRAALLEVRLEEIFGVPEQQNLPGTIDQYPNWRRKLPLSVQEMRQRPEGARLAARLRKYRSVSRKQ